ncbi:MAG: 5-formyltetrahydrofolate cyclo-ligase [Deltaproteobacteria bacterium]
MGTSAEEAKRIKRSHFRRERGALSAAQEQARAQRLGDLSATSPLLHDAATIAAYIACDGEIDPALLVAQRAAAGVQILLPRILPDRLLEFAPAAAYGEPLVLGPHGILQPSGGTIELGAPPQPRLMLVPSVALDRQGRRLGRGGGYYDRLLPAARRHGWVIVGLCHAEHLVDTLPVEDHDARVDACLTNDGLLIPSLGG